MEVEKSRNGLYTLTFVSKTKKDAWNVLKELNRVGEVADVVQNFQRIFIRFKKKEDAELALKKFGSVYDLRVANNKPSDKYNFEEGINHSHKHYHKHSNNHSAPSTPEMPNVSKSMERLNPSNKIFHLILGNLPKNYTVKDVNDLVAEAKPVSISQLDETRVFNIKFCHIALDSAENLTYLIDKLNGFVICGEKLMAAEVKHLLEWNEKAV